MQNAMDKSRKFNLWEISLFKIYIISVTLLFSIRFPIILSSSIYYYLILFIILDIFSLSVLIKKEWNFLKKIFGWEKNYKVFKNYWMFDFWLFKVTMVSFWLLLAKAFPVILTLNIWVYIIIFLVGAWYFINVVFMNKNNFKKAL
jgi:hypothetical protein